MTKQRAARVDIWAGALLMLAIAIGMVAATATSVHAPAIVGDWAGSLTIGGRSLAVVIHLSRDRADSQVPHDGRPFPGEVTPSERTLKLVLKLKERI